MPFLPVWRRCEIACGPGRLATAATALGVLAFVLAPSLLFAWGDSTQKLVINKAIDTLPGELRGFFDSNRAFLLRHVTDPFDAISINTAVSPLPRSRGTTRRR